MSDTHHAAKTYPPSPEMAANAHVDAATYDRMYKESMTDPDSFWREQAKRVDWIKPFSQVQDVDFTLGKVKINWYADGTLNVSANCVDRHLATRRKKPSTSPMVTCTRRSTKWPMCSRGWV